MFLLQGMLRVTSKLSEFIVLTGGELVVAGGGFEPPTSGCLIRQ